MKYKNLLLSPDPFISFLLLFVPLFLYAANPTINYRMDECYWNGTKAEVKNSSSNKYNATAENGANTDSNATLGGMICRVGDFDGKYISLTKSYRLPKSYTATFWVKFPLKGTPNQFYIDEGWFRSHYYKVYVIGSVRGAGDIGFFLKDKYNDYQFGIYTNDKSTNYTNIPNLRDGWHFFAMKVENGETTLYIDQNDRGYTIYKATRGDLTIVGSSTDYTSDETIGSYMDEFKIFDGVLNRSEIKKIYNNEKDRKNYDGTTRTCHACFPKPIANYRMDKCYWNGSTGDVKDSSTDGIDNSGTITGQMIEITKQGKIYNGGEFGGGAIDINNLNVSTAKNTKTTVDFWMYWDGTNSIMPFGWRYYDLWLVNGKFGFNTGNSDIYGIADSSSLKNGWHHITAVFNNGDYTENKLYIDGVSQTLAQQRSTQAPSRAVVASSARIGGWKASNGYRFRGKIDELKIWNGELSASTIKKIYNNEKAGKNYDGTPRVDACIDPIANYRMDSCFWDGHTGDVLDSSYNHFNGTSQNGASTESNTTAGGGICHVGKFDSSKKQHIKIPNFLKIKGSRTITAWIKVNTLNQNGRIFADDRNDNTGDYALSYGDPAPRVMRFYIRGLSPVSLDSHRVIIAKKWFFIVARFDSIAMKKSLYIYDANGNLKDSVVQTVSGKLKYSQGYASIGGELSTATEANRMQFDGDIDEVKIFDKALLDTQIVSIYNNELSKHDWNGAVRTCYICGDPVANYEMDECSWNNLPGSVKDSSGNNDNGTLTGSLIEITKQGKIYNGGEFGGGAIDINNLNVSTAKNTKTTVDFWMYWDGTNSIMPFGWRYYDLWLVNGKFGFNTGNSDIYGIADSSSLKNGWHHITAVFNNGDYTENKLYIDGVSQTLAQQRSTQAPSRAVVASSARIGGWKASNGYRFRGKIDELKIWNGEIGPNRIWSIYNNENGGLNWNGISRSMPMCGLGGFDAWDIFRNINDRNISTKIVKQDFNLTIASLDANNTNYQEFNGTVCANIQNSVSTLIFNDQNSSTATFRINKAIKNTRVKLSWKKDFIGTCPLSNEDNSTLSTDNFAIRPERFHIDTNTTSPKAGVNFHIDVNASSYNGENSLDYNETNNTSFVFDINDSNATCVKGILKGLPTPFRFSNGSISFDANYSDVGDVNFSIKEVKKCTDRFAGVDCKDKNVSGYWNTDANLSIPAYSKTVILKPYRFVITDYSFTRNNPDSNWRYMGDVNDANITVSFKVEAQNANGGITHKFDKKCYAHNVGVKIGGVATSTDANISYLQKVNNTIIYAHDRNLSDFNLSTTINDQNFTDGNSSVVMYALNVYKKYNKPINPLDINITDINTTNSQDAINKGLIPDNNGSSFYYGRVLSKNITTNQQKVTNSLALEVYDSNSSDLFVNGLSQDSLKWFQMKKDTFTHILNFIPKSGFLYSDSNVSGIDDINTTQSILKGTVSFNITNHWSNSQNAYIHIDIPLYLWYSHYNEYNATKDCSTHPCFQYIYIINNKKNNIQSGDFNGTSIGKDYNATRYQRGIKVFR